ncbi:MAG: hypothetical protein IPQ04_03300 [Saprospiraceae bacterium]|nr:hypothetical protein [Saprospiraceae bacterium]
MGLTLEASTIGGKQVKDASKNGYEFWLFSNTKIPAHVKNFCDNKGIKYIETLE